MNAVMDQASGDNWALFNGDAVEVLRELPDRSAHLAVFSPPFSSLYTYTPSEKDLGNVTTREEFFEHFGYVTRELRRVLVPGRTVAMHTGEIQQYASRDGIRNRYDFPGDCIRHMESEGFAYRARITIDKNAQTQAIRNHPVELMFQTLDRDASKLGMAIADYVLLFTVPGTNPIPIKGDVSKEEWITWARPVWTDIREMDILPVYGSKGDDEERHLCPLQLPVIERLVRLFSNRGETTLDPFNGIGSTGYVSLKHHRRYVGIELKPSYFRVAAKHLAEAEQLAYSGNLFSVQDAEQMLAV